MFTRIERTEAIATLEKEFTGATGIYMTDFNKIDVNKMTRFRADLRNAGMKYIVVKNTLARIALEKCNFNELVQYLKGPIGMVISKDNAITPAKIIKDFRKNNSGLLDLKAAYIDGTLFNAEEISKIADLPGKDALLSQLLSCLNAPMSNLVGSLNQIFLKLIHTFEAVKNKKELDSRKN